MIYIIRHFLLPVLRFAGFSSIQNPASKNRLYRPAIFRRICKTPSRLNLADSLVRSFIQPLQKIYFPANRPHGALIAGYAIMKRGRTKVCCTLASRLLAQPKSSEKQKLVALAMSFNHQYDERLFCACLLKAKSGSCTLAFPVSYPDELQTVAP